MTPIKSSDLLKIDQFLNDIDNPHKIQNPWLRLCGTIPENVTSIESLEAAADRVADRTIRPTEVLAAIKNPKAP